MNSKKLLFLIGGIEDQWISEAEQYQFHTFRRRHFSIIFIAAVLLLTTAALAVRFGWSTALIEYLHPTHQQMQDLKSNTQTEPYSDTQNGATVTILQTLTDQNGIYVLYQLCVPDGVELHNETSWLNHALILPLKEQSDISVQTTEEAIIDHSANTRTVLLYTQSSACLERGTLQLIFQDLGYYDFENEEFITQIPGSWELEYPLVYEEIGKNYEVNHEIQIGQKTYPLNHIYLSPLSLTFTFESVEEIDLKTVTIEYKDGRIVTYPGSQLHFLKNTDSNTYETQWTCVFQEIITVEDVKSVQIGSWSVPLEESF